MNYIEENEKSEFDIEANYSPDLGLKGVEAFVYFYSTNFEHAFDDDITMGALGYAVSFAKRYMKDRLGDADDLVLADYLIKYCESEERNCCENPDFYRGRVEFFKGIAKVKFGDKFYSF